MRAQPAPEENPAAAVAPKIALRARWRVEHVEVAGAHRLRVRFVDGLEGLVDMSGLVHSEDAGVFSELSNLVVFSQVRIELGAVTWPGGIDLAPDAMYRAIKIDGCWQP